MRHQALLWGVAVLLITIWPVLIGQLGTGSKREFAVQFKSISSILRADLTAVYVVGGSVYVGDEVGSLSLWAYDSVNKVLEFKDISREVAGALPSHNKVLNIMAINGGAVVLTNDGKLSVYPISAFTITSKIGITLSEPLKQFTLYSIGTDLIIAGIDKFGAQLCLYKLHSLTEPNPVTKLTCNSTTKNLVYSGVAYDSVNQLISVGDSTRIILFTVHNSTLKYLCEAYLQKSEGNAFKSVFSDSGVLLTINDLWVSSLVIDMAVPYAKVISSARTARLVKTGGTNWLSVNRDPSASSVTVLINSNSKTQSYILNDNNKLSHAHITSKFGKLLNFILLDSETIFAAVDQSVLAIQIDKIGGFTQLSSSTIQSHNHFAAVTGMTYWNGYLVTGSAVAKDNVKLWKLGDGQLAFVDQSTVEFTQLLQTRSMGFSEVLAMPEENQKIGRKFSVAMAGEAPYKVVIVSVNSSGKFDTVIKSKQSHSDNVTSLLLGSDQRTLITSSLDSHIRVWRLSVERDSFEGSGKAIKTEYGAIQAGVADSTGSYFLYGHSQSSQSQLANITLWKFDEKEGVIKLAQNVPWEAHEANITQLELSSDQRYFATLSQSGQLRLWQHKSWTAVDLLASLALGFTDCSITMTSSNSLIIETPTEFIKYAFDFNGFYLLGRSQRQFTSEPSSSLIVGDNLISGDVDGAIRVYRLS